MRGAGDGGAADLGGPQGSRLLGAWGRTLPGCTPPLVEGGAGRRDLCGPPGVLVRLSGSYDVSADGFRPDHHL